MSASFEEKSAAATLLIVLATYAWYGYIVAGSAPMARSDVVALIISVIVITVIAEIVFHALIATHNRDTMADERDRLIAALAGRAEGVALIVGVIATIGYTLMHEQAGPIVTVHLLMFTLALGEVVKRVGQLYYYRRGVRS